MHPAATARTARLVARGALCRQEGRHHTEVLTLVDANFAKEKQAVGTAPAAQLPLRTARPWRESDYSPSRSLISFATTPMPTLQKSPDSSMRAPARLRITADRRHWIIAEAQPTKSLTSPAQITAALEINQGCGRDAPALKISPHWESRILRVDDADLAVAKVLACSHARSPSRNRGRSGGKVPFRRPPARVAVGPFLHRSTITPGSRCVIHAMFSLATMSRLGEKL